VKSRTAYRLVLFTLVSVVSIPAYASIPVNKPLQEECKVYDILKGQLILSRSDGKNIAEITSINGNVTDGHHLYDVHGMQSIPSDEYFKKQISRTQTPFAPMAILFQPSGEELQVISVRTLKPVKYVTLFSNINHILIRETKNGRYNKLGPVFEKTQKEAFYYPLFQSIGFKDSILPHIQKGSDLTICFR
jgi:hypothetical protein